MLLFSLLLYLPTPVLSKPITQGIQSFSLRTSLGGIRSKAQNPEVCSRGERTIVVDAVQRSQTLQWSIGAIEATSTPVQCETTMSMDYNPQWQYAVTEVNWHAYANIPQGSSATTGLSYGFGQGGTTLPATLNWLITGPLDSVWDQKYGIPAASQEWSRCGAVSPLTFQWSVKITPAVKSLATLFQPLGQLGKTTSTRGNLTLGIITNFRECTGAPQQPVLPLVQPTPTLPQSVKPTPKDEEEKDSWRFWEWRSRNT